MLTPRFVSSLGALGVGLGCLLVGACSDDPATAPPNATPAPDAGPAKVLGFVPSNLGATLERVDVAALTDIEVSGTRQSAAKACEDAGAGCVVLENVPGSNGGTLTVYLAKSWVVPQGTTLRLKGATPTVIVATGAITVNGTVDASSFFDDGPNSRDQTLDGPGSGASLGESIEASLNGPGSGGVGNTKSTPKQGGGGGAHCGAGGRGSGPGGFGGQAHGTLALVPLSVGGSGGGGYVDGIPPSASYQGPGGGAVALVSAVSITVNQGGRILANGGDGSPTFAGGGGGGGSILLEAPTVSNAGTIAANGGLGGGARGSGINPDIIVNGGSGETTTGEDGETTDPTRPVGGGGGVGRIAVNTADGTFAKRGILSPATTTACTTIGKLATE